MSQPFDMVVIGGTGDLARRKLLPSLYFLHKYGELDPQGRIIAVARHEMSTEAYRQQVEEACRQEIPPEEFSDEVWASFAERFDYGAAPSADAKSYRALDERFDLSSDRIRVFYLATSPSIYGALAHALGEAGLVNEKSRIVLEKPVGRDLRSAEEINSRVGEIFQEDQIYRIDHYLGKETV